ncbi:MAG: winged helix-turn-helix transcriptional regulator [Candidatus Methanomethylophilaceae archaeon]
MTERPSLDCAADATMSVIGGRWKSTILCLLSRNGTLRFSELQRKITGISPRILSKQLKELERDGVVSRNETGEKPVKVEYSLTSKGKSLIPVLSAIAEWGLKYMYINVITIGNAEEKPVSERFA